MQGKLTSVKRCKGRRRRKKNKKNTVERVWSFGWWKSDHWLVSSFQVWNTLSTREAGGGKEKEEEEKKWEKTKIRFVIQSTFMWYTAKCLILTLKANPPERKKRNQEKERKMLPWICCFLFFLSLSHLSFSHRVQFSEWNNSQEMFSPSPQVILLVLLSGMLLPTTQQ